MNDSSEELKRTQREPVEGIAEGRTLKLREPLESEQNGRVMGS